MIVLKTLWRLLASAMLFAAVPALAVPVGYGFDSGFVNVTAVRTSDNSLVFSETLLLGQTSSGSSFVIWDTFGTPSGFGQGTIDDIVIETAPNQGPFTLIQPYGPFDTVSIDSISIVASPTFSTTISIPDGSGGFNPFSMEILDTTPIYSASHSSGVPPPVMGILAPIVGLNKMTGFVNEGAGSLTIHINGALMGTLDGAPFGELDDLEITGDITWFGSTSSFVVVPEPSMALLIGMGLAALSAGRRRA